MAMSTYRHILRRHNPENGPTNGQVHSNNPLKTHIAVGNNRGINALQTMANHKSNGNMNEKSGNGTSDTLTQTRILSPKLSPKLTSMLLSKQPFKQSNMLHTHNLNHPINSDEKANQSSQSTIPTAGTASATVHVDVNTSIANTNSAANETNSKVHHSVGTTENANSSSSSTSSKASTAATTGVTPSSRSPTMNTTESIPTTPSSSTMKVVILGGSFSGLSVAITLAKNLPKDRTLITIVEPKSYLEVRWATIRSLFDDAVCDASTVPLSKILADHSATITHVRAFGTSVALDTVTLDDGRNLPYDVLLVATGAVTNFEPLTPHLSPGTILPGADSLSKRRSFLRETGIKILNSRSVLVVGGGPVGTELAADVASYAIEGGHKTRVTLVDSNEKIMPGYPRSIAQKLRDKLSSLRVRVILGQHAIPSADGSGWELRSSGKRLDADYVITATGTKPCGGDIFGETSECTRDGWIRTDRFGRVIGCRGDVFAAGDCCDWTAKSGENTLANRTAYAHNIRLTVEAIANSRALASIDNRLKRVSVSHRAPAIVASSPREGEVTSPFAALSPSWWWMKNRGMLLSKAQKEIGW